MEEWRDVPWWEGYYQVSDQGRVRSLDRYKQNHSKLQLVPSKIMVGSTDKHRYRRVVLCKNNKRFFYTIHKLVMMAFVGTRPNGYDCCHYDGNPSNNRLDNLRYDTKKGNCADTIRHGKSQRGERCPFGKMKEGEIVLMKRLIASRKFTQVNIAKMFKVDQSLVSHIKRGFAWGWL